MTPPAATLVLLAGERIVRADFDPGAKSPATLQSAPRSRNTAPADAVRAALALGGKPRRDVWVLSGEFWAQSVDLNRSQVTGLSDEQIARALSFEIEPFSGIPVTESALGFRRLGAAGGSEAFWIVELTTADRDAIQRAVAESGGRLAGVGHPGGMPHSLSANGGAPWQRLESWDSGLIWITSDGGRSVQTRAVNALPARATLPASGAFEALSTNGRSPVPEAASDLPWQRFTLQDDAPLRLWIERWRAASAGGDNPVPLVAPAAPPPSPRRYYVAAAALELFVIFVCAAHAFVVRREKADLDRRSAQITGSARLLEEATKQSAGLRQELTKLKAGAQQREHIAARRESVHALLRALAASRPDDIVIRGIQADSASSMVVSGVAIEPSVVDEMSLLLNTSLRPAGWTAQPLQKTARHALSNGGPWEFSIRVTHDTGTAPVRTPAKGGAR